MRQEGVEVRFASAPTLACRTRPRRRQRRRGLGRADARHVHQRAGPQVRSRVLLRGGDARSLLPDRSDGKTRFQARRSDGQARGTVSEVPTPWLCLQEDMRRAGLDPAKLDRVTDRSMASNAAALRRGEVDAVQLFQPFVEELLEERAGHIWYAAAERGPTSYTTLYARRALLAERRDECERMVRAIHRTLKWVHASDGAQLAAAIAAYFPDVPPRRSQARSIATRRSASGAETRACRARDTSASGPGWSQAGS